MSEYNTYTIGQTAILEGYNVDEDGVPTSPTDPHLLLKVPAGTESELALTEDPVGHVFHNYLVVGPAGRYFYRIVTADDAIEKFFVVMPSAFADPLP